MKPIKIALALVIVTLVGVIVWEAWQQREPIYKGKRLSAWLKDYHPQPFGVVFIGHTNSATEAEVEEAQLKGKEALRAAGTNAIPTLLRMLRANDSPMKVRFLLLAQKQHIVKIEHIPSAEWNWIAAAGFGVLGTNARSAAPALVEIANQTPDPGHQMHAILALDHLMPLPKETIPSLWRLEANSNMAARIFARRALSQIDHSLPLSQRITLANFFGENLLDAGITNPFRPP